MTTGTEVTPILEARGLVKRYGHVTALAGSDFDLRPGEILAVIGDNGAGKSSLIKCLSGAVDAGRGGDPARRQADPHAHADRRARATASRPSTRRWPCRRRSTSRTTCSSAASRGRPGSWARSSASSTAAKMRAEARQADDRARDHDDPGHHRSRWSRSPAASARAWRSPRAAAFGSKVIILDEPTAALGVKESAHVLELILKVRDSGIPVILISHNMPHVFEVADRIHIHRLGQRIAVVTPKTHTMNEVVAIMTGAAEPGAHGLRAGHQGRAACGCGARCGGAQVHRGRLTRTRDGEPGRPSPRPARRSTSEVLP